MIINIMTSGNALTHAKHYHITTTFTTKTISSLYNMNANVWVDQQLWQPHVFVDNIKVRLSVRPMQQYNRIVNV